MTADAQANQEQQAQQPKVSDKEYNFRMLEAKYEKQLAQERAARLEAEKAAQEAFVRKSNVVEEEEDEDPYIDKKKLKKELNRFNEQTKQMTQSEIQKAVQIAREQERQEAWLESNPDFAEVMQQHADKLYHKNPALAKTILNMPEGFERQKLAYYTIKSMGLDKPEIKQPTIQDKVDANKRSPYYQPSEMGTAPYQKSADFSPQGQKQAYQKMQELKQRLRLG